MSAGGFDSGVDQDGCRIERNCSSQRCVPAHVRFYLLIKVILTLAVDVRPKNKKYIYTVTTII